MVVVGIIFLEFIQLREEMMMASAIDLRTRVLQAVDAGMTVETAAETYSASSRTICHWRARMRERGSPQPRDGKTGPKLKLESFREQIQALIPENSGITLEKLQTKLWLPVYLSTIWLALKTWDIVLKRALRAAEQLSPDVVRQRRWRDMLRMRQPPERYVFIDETGTNTTRARRSGCGPKSARVVSAVSHGHWKTTTFVDALRTTGLIAPMVMEGARNGEWFLAYVKQQRISAPKSGEIVLIYSSSTHKTADA